MGKQLLLTTALLMLGWAGCPSGGKGDGGTGSCGTDTDPCDSTANCCSGFVCQSGRCAFQSGGSNSSTGGSSSGASGTGTGGTGTHSSVGTSGGQGSSSQSTGLGSSSTTGAASTSSGGSAGSSFLLVDNDGNTQPSGNPDPSLTTFQNWLGGASIAYSTYQEPSDNSDPNDVDASDPTLAGINTIVFFTGDNDSAPLTSGQQALLQTWLNAGGHTLVLFSASLVYDIGVNSWTDNETNAFLGQDVGALTDVDNPQFFDGSSGDIGLDGTTSAVVTGGSAAPSFSGKKWTVTNGTSSVSYYFSIIGPATGDDILATVQADPAQTGTANSTEPVALGRKHVGTAGSSTVVWIGFTVENIQANLTGFNSLADFFTAVQTYAAL